MVFLFDSNRLGINVASNKANTEVTPMKGGERLVDGKTEKSDGE